MFAPYSAALTQPRFPALLAFFDCGNLVCSRVRQMFGLWYLRLGNFEIHTLVSSVFISLISNLLFWDNVNSGPFH